MSEESVPTRVFVSYSRQNEAFARDLLVSLESHGFETFFDREDLMPGEPWQARLRSLIHQADTVAYVVSEASLTSEECVKELRIALEQGKRIIPLVIEDAPYDQLPEELRRLQFVFFHGPGRSYAKGLAELVTALKTDADWVRAHTRFTDGALEWIAADRKPGYLLPDEQLANALAWMAKPKPATMSIAPHTAEFIERSRERDQSNKLTQARANVRRIMVASVAVLLAIGLGVAVYLWLEAREQQEASKERIDILEEENSRLREQLAAAAQGAPVEPESARVTIDDMAPYFANLESDNAILRRGTRDDIASRLNGLADGDLNRSFIARLRASRSYREQIGGAYALSRLQPDAPISQRDEAIADLQAMCAASQDATLRRNLAAALRVVAQGDRSALAGCA